MDAPLNLQPRLGLKRKATGNKAGPSKKIKETGGEFRVINALEKITISSDNGEVQKKKKKKIKKPYRQNPPKLVSDNDDEDDTLQVDESG